MKKALLLLAPLILIFTLIGCGDKPPSLEDRVNDYKEIEGEEELSFTGVIESFEFDIYKDGTHQIFTEENELIIIQSPTINLNNYIDKKVTITGSMQKLIDNKGKVFTVEDVKLLEIDEGEIVEYENQSFGFKLNYSNIWNLKEDADGISFKSGGEKRVTVDVYNADMDLNEFVTFHEIEDGTSVTIAAQRSMRYVEEDEIRLYVPNPSKEKVYKIIFFGEEELQKELFYDFLESFELIVKRKVVGEKCGGEEALECPEEFRCELESAESDAEGVCVPLDGEEIDPDCPFVPVPSGCTDYAVKSKNINDCPTSYECLDPVNESADNPSADEPIDEPADEPIEEPIYEPAGVEPEPEPEPVAVEEPADDSSADEPTGEPEILNNMRLYENPHKDFSIRYNRNFYYASYGAINGTIWSVGFADAPLDSYSDAIITVVILEGASAGKREQKGDKYLVEAPRDNESHFLITGPLERKDEIDVMAQSIVQE
jgi:hypothetical protein